jgi:hypothetical protein
MHLKELAIKKLDQSETCSREMGIGSYRFLDPQEQHKRKEVHAGKQ